MPFEQLLVLLMARVGHDFEEVVVAPGAAHVLGRAAPFGLQEARIGRAGLSLRDAFLADLVGRYSIELRAFDGELWSVPAKLELAAQ